MADKEKKQPQQKAVKKELPDLSNKALMDEMQAVAKQMSVSADEKRVDLAVKTIQLSIQAVRTEDKKASLAAYKSLRSIQGEISNLAFQSEEEQKRFHALYDGALKSAEKSSSLLGVIAHDLTDNTKKMLPTLSSFGKQLISNSHPALRIALDLAKDTKNYLSDAKKRTDEANKEGREQALTEAEVLLKQSQTAQSQEKLVEKQEALIEEQRQDLKQASEERQEQKKARKEGPGPLVSRMEAVRANTEAHIGLLESIRDALSGDKKVTVVQAEGGQNKETPSQAVDQRSNKDVLDKLELQVSELNKANATLESMNQSQSRVVQLQEETIRKQEMATLKALEDENKNRPSTKAGFLEREKETKKGDGFLSSLVGETLGNLFALGGPRIIGAMLKPLSKIAGGALKAVPVVGTVIAGVTAMFDFVDGFKNAGEILGKENVTTFDKVSAGIGSVLGGLTSIVDFTAKLFGFETDFAPTVKESVSKFLAAIPDFIVETFDNTMAIFGLLKDEAMKKVEDTWSTVSGIFNDLMEFIPKMVMDAIPGSKYVKEGFERMKGWFSDDPQDTQQNASVAQLPTPPKTEVIRNSEKATVNAEDEAKKRAEDSKAAQVNMPVTNNTRVDASSVSVYNQPLSSRNNDRSNWAGMGNGAKTV